MLRSDDSEHSLASLTVAGTTFKVGRNDGSDLRLEHHAFPLLVSRNHAEFFIEDGRLVLRNLNPLNGTYVSGRRLEGGEAVLVSDGDIISFGGSKVVHSTDGQTQQCNNPHTYVVDGLHDFLPTSLPLARVGNRQRSLDPLADTLSAASAVQEELQPSATHPAQEAADRPPPASMDHSAAHTSARTLESTAPQELQQQLPVSAAQPSASWESNTARGPFGRPDSSRPPSAEALQAVATICDMPLPPAAGDGRLARPQNNIIDLTEADDDDEPIITSPPLSASVRSEGVMRRWADRQRLKRRAWSQCEGSLAVDDEDIEILHGSQAAAVLASARAPQNLPFSSAAAAPASAAGPAAKQGDWVKDLEDEMGCAVCQETIVAAHSLVPCGHCFCGNCLFQWLSRKQICPTCRQRLEAPPVRSTVLDNIMDKSERSMSPDELEDRKQRKVNWQAFSDEAVTAWKAMFSRSKRQHTQRPEREVGGGRLPPFMIDAIMGAGGGAERLLPAEYAYFEDVHDPGAPSARARLVRRARHAEHYRNLREMQALRHPEPPGPRRADSAAHAMVPPPPPPYPPPTLAHPRNVRGTSSRGLHVLQPSDMIDMGPGYRRSAAVAHQHQQGGSNLRVEYPLPSAQPTYCLACRRGFQAEVPRLVSGTHSPIAWHLDCYQLWPMLAGRMATIPGISLLAPVHQLEVRRRLSNHRQAVV